MKSSKSDEKSANISDFNVTMHSLCYMRTNLNTTESTRKIGTIAIAWIASSSIRRIVSIVNSRKRFMISMETGFRMTLTIETIETILHECMAGGGVYAKLQALFSFYRFFRCLLRCLLKRRRITGIRNKSPQASLTDNHPPYCFRAHAEIILSSQAQTAL